MRQSVFDPRFTTTLAEWLEERDELLVMLRYPNAGGARDYELHRSLQSIENRLRQVPMRTSVIVFRELQLPIRGVVDDALITRALIAIPEGAEFLLVETVLTTVGRASWYHQENGTTHSELKESLESSRGRPVILGLDPPWLEDGPCVISGYVPDPNGQVTPAAY